ncbi:MAG: ABC transporter permease, partial [Armatimonadetes bacterium]|nr:ABC transporter permease [Armatimonadota bacterium]
ALLAFMIPYLGLGAKPAIAALFLYALLPVLRNTYTGIRGVDPALVEVGLGMGLRARQILTLVEIPLAMPVIMAGIRTAAVISIGTATLAAWIGAGGLGDPIVTGLTRNDVPTILTGAIPAAVLAVVVDLALGGLERLVTPRTG